MSDITDAFQQMCADQTADRVWFRMPRFTLSQLEQLSQIAENDTCPQCGKCRVFLRMAHTTIGTVVHLTCIGSTLKDLPPCGYDLDITDYESF